MYFGKREKCGLTYSLASSHVLTRVTRVVKNINIAVESTDCLYPTINGTHIPWLLMVTPTHHDISSTGATQITDSVYKYD